MFLKLALVYLLWRITGNPILAIVVLLVILYFVDRRFVGLFPSVTGPFRRQMRMSYLRRQLEVNVHDMSARMDLARAYIEIGQYRKALERLEGVRSSMQGEPEVLCHTGLCHVALGRLEVGENLILQALEKEPRIRYGEPYLRLATAYADSNPDKALAYLEKFQRLNVSSCESYYRLAQIQGELGNRDARRKALEECRETYRLLPRFRKRQERRWATLAALQRMSGR